MKGARVAVGVLAVALASGTARAELWCAAPVRAHEWGVQIFDGDGNRSVSLPSLPSWFHRDAPAAPQRVQRVADLPPDSGIRLLPVVHFHAPGGGFSDPIPLGVAVGFSYGRATHWYPQVDVLRPADAANSAAARALRAGLEKARAQLKGSMPRITLPDDPTRQLEWQHLSLTNEPRATAHAATEPWVKAARALPGALWVSQHGEAERFLFYEGATRERAAVRVRRSAAWSESRREYIVENPTAHPVHDVVLLVGQGATRLVGEITRIPAGSSATVTLTIQRVSTLREALRARWTTEPGAKANTAERDGRSGCTMGRDPAVPVEASAGHRLYAAEVDLLLSTWGATLFDAPGPTVVYREDPAYLDEAMPISLFTDMFHYVELRRLSLAIWQKAPL